MNLLTAVRVLDMVVGPVRESVTPRMLFFALLAAIPAVISWLVVTLFKKN